MSDSIFSRHTVAFFTFLCLPIGAAAQAIDEIIVTADFRERAAGDLPASVVVLDAKEIRDRAVQHFEELVYAVPNLNWSGDGHRARYFQIRGVGELEQYQGAPNPSVGFLIDDIDFSGIGTVATLFDMQQVEILRGPQGSRYGANALAGLIYMRSAAPAAERNGLVQLSVADDDALSGGIAFGGSLSSDDRVTFRVSAHHHESNGYRDNSFLGRDDTNGRDETAVRGRLRWQANDEWQVDVAAMFADVDNGYDAFALDNGYTVLSDKPGKDAQQSIGVSARAEYSGWADYAFTSITAVADSEIDFSFDADWGNDDSWAPVTYDFVSLNDRKRVTISQELRLEAADWILGAYAMRLEDELDTLNLGDYFDPFFDFADSLFDPLQSDYSATNIALFGQLERNIKRRFDVSVGLRVEHRDADYRDSSGLTASPSEAMWGGELTLSHETSDTITSYVSLSRGYKAGGFNLGIVPETLRDFDAEALWSLEAGIKSRLLDDSLYLNASLFVNRREDQQVRTSFQLVPGDPASFVFLTVNADRGETIGLEADLHWYPSESWMLYASVGSLSATFEKFIERPDLVGRAQAHAPYFTLAMGGQYSHPSGVFARVDVSARDEFFFDVSHDQKSSSYELVNARVGYETSDWTVQLWARNLFDEAYAVRGFFFGNEPPDFPDTLYTRLGDPRQVGVTLERRF